MVASSSDLSIILFYWWFSSVRITYITWKCQFCLWVFRFELVVVYMSSLTTFIAYGTTAMDSTIVSLFTQAKTQLQTLKFDLEHLMDPYDEMIDTVHDSLDSRFEYRSSEKFNSHLRRRFVRCIKHQHLIVWYSIISLLMIFC